MRIQKLSLNIAAASILFVLIAAVASAEIVFISDRDGSIDIYESDIYVMDDEGRRVRRVTNDLLYKSRPRWAPDGSRLLTKCRSQGKAGTSISWMLPGNVTGPLSRN